MPALSRGQPNTPSILNWFVTVGGVNTDVNDIGFRILDISAGLPGTQVYPASPNTYEDITTGTGHFAVGSYFAYNNEDNVGWTPSLGEALGTHRIEWRWRLNSSDDYQIGSEDFEVLVESAGSSDDMYISVQSIRDEGVTSQMVSDLRVISAIQTWQALLERACRQWFTPKTLIIRFDGTDSDALHMGVPIISVDYIKLNNSREILDPCYYRVYNSITYPDDRRNPRIKLVMDDYRDIYTAPLDYGRLKFRKGRQNQEIKGSFGFVEADGSVPRLIVRALTKLVIQKITTPVYSADPGDDAVTPPPLLTGILKKEETDGHSREYATAGGDIKPRAPGLIGITQDQEILDIIKLYRAPLGIATPNNPSYT